MNRLLITLIFLIFSVWNNYTYSQCVESAVNGNDGDTFVYTCTGDDQADVITFSNNGEGDANYAYIITDENNNILGLPNGNSQNFNDAPEGTCRVWGVSYSGALLDAEMGENLGDIGSGNDCLIVSSNYISIVRTVPFAGTVVTSGGDTYVSVCPTDGVADYIVFGNYMESPNLYTYVITDDGGNILGFTNTGQDFEGAPAGICYVYGLSYTGNIDQESLLGQNIEGLVFSDDCYVLTENNVIIDRTVGGLFAGEVVTESGDTEATIITGDGISDYIVFGNYEESDHPYTFIVTDNNNNILGYTTTGQDFEGAPPGECHVWGLAYTGDLNMEASIGENIESINLSTSCYDLTDNYVTIYREGVQMQVVEGGTISTEDNTNLCLGVGVADIINVELADAIGESSAWVITDTDGNILGLPGGSPFDFSGAGTGVCILRHLSYEGDLQGLAAGLNINDITGNYAWSNSITVDRTEIIGGQVVTVSGDTEATIITGDGISDYIIFGNYFESDNLYTYIITDDNNNILGSTNTGNDFEGAPVGECHVWGLSYTGDLNIEALLGENIETATLTSACYGLSENYVTIYRMPAEIDEVNGGTISTEDATDLCLGDAIADVVDVLLTDASGANSAWVITDTYGNILGLPGGSPFDFGAAGTGVCVIRHLSYNGVLTGLGAGLNIGDLTGDYDWSNSIEVNRNQVVGGSISTEDATEICLSSGVVAPLNFTLEGAEGSNGAWLVTDLFANIIGYSTNDEFDIFDFTGITFGEYYVWHLMYEDGLEGLELGNTPGDFIGCFSLSNNVLIAPIGYAGGMISTEDQTNICTGDGNPDMIDVTLDGAVGPNSTWVITDGLANILALPASPPFDLEGAGGGTCLIWHLSHDNDLFGLTVGNSVGDISGCFSLSNPITVNRTHVFGGQVVTDFGATEIFTCTGDGEPDYFTFGNYNEAEGSYIYIVTTDTDHILAFTETGQDFEGAPAGQCHVWGLSYNGDIDMENLIGQQVTEADLATGCYDLSSNYVTVNRIDVSECSEPSNFTAIENDQNQSVKAELGEEEESIVEFNNNIEISNKDLAINELSLAPNPVQKALQVSLNLDRNMKESSIISIFNANGQIMSQRYVSSVAGLNTYEIDVQDLSIGVYFLTVQNGDEKMNVKFIKE